MACSSRKIGKDKRVREEENLRVSSLVKYIRENGSILLSVDDRFNKMKTKD